MFTRQVNGAACRCGTLGNVKGDPLWVGLGLRKGSRMPTYAPTLRKLNLIYRECAPLRSLRACTSAELSGTCTRGPAELRFSSEVRSRFSETIAVLLKSMAARDKSIEGRNRR